MPTADQIVVRARNTGDKDVPIPHLGSVLVVKAGQERIVPWDAMASLWGDPGVVDTRAGSRHEQAMRHRGQFGWFNGLNPEESHDRDGVHHAGWDELRPTIEWYTVDDNKRIWTVLDDPTGEKAAREGWDRPQEPIGDEAYRAQQIATLQRQVEALQREQDDRNADAQRAEQEQAKQASADASDELPKPDPDEKPTKDDTPSQPRTSSKGR